MPRLTENAAAGIWSFQHNYINPCFGFVAGSIEQCTSVCLGDHEERLRRRRECERAGDLAEYSFDFYDDWYQEEEREGLLRSWRGEDWDRLLAGTRSQRRLRGADAAEQPRRKAGMSYGTRGTRRNTIEADATIIPSTQPIGLLSRLPWKMGGTLRYKPSAANLQEHPGKANAGESAPLLGLDQDASSVRRERSGTTGSGDTSDSYCSRGDLFPSDGEGEEDAVPIDDEITYDMIRKDDQSNGSKGGGARRSHGKQPMSALGSSRTLSRSTLDSMASAGSRKARRRASFVG